MMVGRGEKTLLLLYAQNMSGGITKKPSIYYLKNHNSNVGNYWKVSLIGEFVLAFWANLVFRN